MAGWRRELTWHTFREGVKPHFRSIVFAAMDKAGCVFAVGRSGMENTVWNDDRCLWNTNIHS